MTLQAEVLINVRQLIHYQIYHPYHVLDQLRFAQYVVSILLRGSRLQDAVGEGICFKILDEEVAIR